MTLFRIALALIVATGSWRGAIADDGLAEHWSFRPIRVSAPPRVRTDGARNGIDGFVLARLERNDLRPSPEAEPPTLVRRLFLDVLGLPPDPDEVDAFAADPRPEAWERLVDRVLANVHHGERWGRHWLDQARYADSHGYTNDGSRSMWPYRDWVIDAVNADMPFDRFTVEQLAGDLLPEPTRTQLVATGFHRNTLINTEGGTDPEQFRVESVVDRVNTTGQVWLGLTVGCAQCHDHKFDPISQIEFYRLFAFFNHGEDRNSVSPILRIRTPAQDAELVRLRKELQSARAEKADDGRLEKLRERIKKAEKSGYTTMIMRERARPRPTHVLERGDFLREGAPVTAGVPAVLPPLAVGSGDAPPNRLDLARWLVNDRNPLTARVTVNRVWMRYFGRGLVETEEDFGTQGRPPTHPMLLDWLANELIRSEWSMKSLHRLILTSATYRQSSRVTPELLERDPRNLLLARQSRTRVEAEIVRDSVLAASGLLATRIGGPSVYPPQPPGVYNFTQVRKSWKTSRGADRHRRTLYTYFYRSAPYPLLTTFDAPKFNTSCTRRRRSNTPLQALTVSNSEAIWELARGLGARVLRELPRARNRADLDRARITRVFRLCLSRAPEPSELARLTTYVERQRELFEHDGGAAKHVAPRGIDVDEHAGALADAAAFASLARVLVNLDEFITRE